MDTSAEHRPSKPIPAPTRMTRQRWVTPTSDDDVSEIMGLEVEDNSIICVYRTPHDTTEPDTHGIWIETSTKMYTIDVYREHGPSQSDWWRSASGCGRADDRIIVQSIYIKIRRYLELIATEIIFVVNHSSYQCWSLVHFRWTSEVRKLDILREKMQFLCKNRGKLENPIPLIFFLSKWCIVNASCTVQCFVRHIKNVIHLGLQIAIFWGKTYGNWRKITKNWRMLFSVRFAFFNDC